MLCGEIISVYCESHSKHTNTPYGQNGELPNTSLLVLCDPGRLDTLIYVVTVEKRDASRQGTVMYVVNVETWRNSLSCHLAALRGTPTFRLMTSPIIWWRSMELHRGSVTFGMEELTLLKYTLALPHLALRFFATATRRYQYLNFVICFRSPLLRFHFRQNFIFRASEKFSFARRPSVIIYRSFL
jgi:hypothetical protein